MYVAFKPYKTPRFDFWLEKKEDVFVLTKEELQDMWDAAQEIHEDACPNDCVPKYKTMDDWINTPKP